MLDTAPAESEKTTWLYVAVAVLAIYATIPVARTLRALVDERLERGVFLYFALALVLAVGWAAFASLRRRAQPPGAYVCMAIILAVSAVFVYRLRGIPEEAIHVAEYGLLGLLVFRALVHRVRDFSIYPASCLIVCMAGIVDEYIQWITPQRVFDLRDVYTNLSAGLLSQLAIAFGLRPANIDGPPKAKSMARLCYLGAAFMLLFCIVLVNTPPRIAWYAGNIAGLEFLLDGNNPMAEYGYRHTDENIGVFRSRFSLDALERLDRERGADVAAILDRYIGGEGYREFLAAHNVIRDAYAHEAGVHLFRRDFHLDRAREKAGEAGEHYHIAYRENLILEAYFPRAIRLSKHAFDAATRQEVSAAAPLERSYESPVSGNLITALREWQAVGLAVLAILALALLGLVLSRGETGTRPGGPGTESS